MRTAIPEKLQALADDIAVRGDAPLTRLTVLKKWFERRPRRLAAFGAWAARYACETRRSAAGGAGPLFDAADALLADAGLLDPGLDPKDVDAVSQRVYAYQKEYRRTSRGRVRVIEDWGLLLMEQGLDLIRRPHAPPFDGYKLAADLCRHYDPTKFNALTGPSRDRVLAVMAFLVAVEAAEGEATPDVGADAGR